MTRRQVAGEIIALLVEGAAGARTLGVPRGGAKVPCRDVEWHLIGLVCRVLDGRNRHVLLSAPVAIVERSVEQLELSRDGRRALIASWRVALVKALQQLVAADVGRRDCLFQGSLPRVVELSLLEARLVGREEASAVGLVRI